MKENFVPWRMLSFPSLLSHSKTQYFRAFVYFSAQTKQLSGLAICLCIISTSVPLHSDTAFLPCVKSSFTLQLYLASSMPSLNYNARKVFLPTTCRSSLSFRIQLKIWTPWRIWPLVPARHSPLFTNEPGSLISGKTNLQPVKTLFQFLHSGFLHLLALVWSSNEDFSVQTP